MSNNSVTTPCSYDFTATVVCSTLLHPPWDFLCRRLGYIVETLLFICLFTSLVFLWLSSIPPPYLLFLFP